MPRGRPVADDRLAASARLLRAQRGREDLGTAAVEHAPAEGDAGREHDDAEAEARRDDAGEWVAVAKASTQKASVGGRKNAARRLDSTRTAREELVFVGDGPEGEAEFEPGSELRPLMVHLVQDGVADPAFLGHEGTSAARAHRAEVMQELPIEAFRLGRGEPVIPTTYR